MRNFLDSLYLSDIGHTNAKIWIDGKVETIPLQKFSPENWREKIYFINVNKSIQNRLEQLPNWIDISENIRVDTDYKTLGIDRKVAIYSSKNEIVVDLGSAITIDIVKDSKHLGGYILLGKEITIKSFQQKTPHLNFQNRIEFSKNSIPQTSEDALYFGFFHPIIYLIESLLKEYNLEVVLTGGDAKEFKSFIDFPTTLKKDLIFNNMKQIVTKNFKI